jgi:eukaryotic-like serine/threonine-protein kinase
MAQTSKKANTWYLNQPLSDKVVGRFLICELLGTGGMGEVYRAEDTMLKRSVALKRMAPSLRADPLFRERFFREAERASRFTDAHVAAIYDVLEDNGEAFLVMEYVEGQTLRQRLCQRLKLDEILEIAEQCTEALAVASSHGVVHCDIKPENIMLTPTGHVKVLDFGVAKLLPRSNQSTTLDKSRTLSGTPGYMAPEVLLENVPDHRSDIFSLGVVLYEALTGSHPFRASSFVGICEKVLRETPPPVTALNPKLPVELNAVIEKMLAKNPSDRFQSAQELRTELRRLPIKTSDGNAGTPERRVTKYEGISLIPNCSQRRRMALLFVAMVLIPSIAIIGPSAYRRLQWAPVFATRGPLLISDFDTLGHVIPDEGLREGLTIALQQSRYVNVYPRSRVYEVLERMKRKDVGRIDEALGREICQRENVHVLLVGSIAQIGEAFQITIRALDPVQGNVLFAEKTTVSHKEEFFDKVDWLARRVRENLGESLPAIESSSRPLAKVTTRSLSALQLYSEATDAFGQGRVGDVPALLQNALDLDPEFAMAHRFMAQIHEMMGNRAVEQEELKHAYDLRQSVTEREKRLIESSYYNLIGDDRSAVDALIALVTLYPDDPDAHALLASEYYDLGDLAKAIQQLRQTIKVDPGSAPAYGKLVTWLARNNAPDEAVQVYGEAAAHGLDSPAARWGLGMALWNQAKIGEAQVEFRRLQAAGPPYDSIGRIYFARILIYQGRLRNASEQLASGIREDQTAKNRSAELLQRYLLARTAVDRGDRTAALRQLTLILRKGEPEAFQAADLERTGALYAQIGELVFARRALNTLDQLQSRNGTAFNKASFHLLAGEIALARGKPITATEHFSTSTAEYPLALAYGGLARAYEKRQDWQRAAAAWQQQLKARGEIFQDEYPTEWVRAHLALARVYGHLGQLAAARTEYEAFLKTWEHAEDLPELRDARQEMQELTPVQGPAH